MNITGATRPVACALLACLLIWLPSAALGGRGPTNALPVAPGTQLPRARVVTVESPGAVVSYTPRLEIIRPMVDAGLTNLTGQPTPAAAWRSLISTQDTVGLKVFSAPGGTSGTRPAVVEAVVQGLREAGLPPRQIIIWDRHLGHLRLAGFTALAEHYGVRVEGSLEAGFETNHFYETPLIGQLVWGDLEFGKEGPGVGRRSYVSKLVTRETTKIISIAPLLNHNLTGVSGHLFSVAMGSVDNALRFANDADRLASAVPEIYALPILGDRVVLNIVDALIAQYNGEERSLLHYSAVLNELRFSTDPVALDVLSIQELDRQRERGQGPSPKTGLQLYQNASLLEIGTSDPRAIQVELVK